MRESEASAADVFCAKAKRQQQMFFCAKAKRQQQMFFCAKAKRQQQHEGRHDVGHFGNATGRGSLPMQVS
ncbi:hypothetical protein ACZ11_01460 [Lysinibacillus xylanilyticus]|uniref:Uncharacterized protein n=1 Tax=Lysinibacillus xylanilyticus TaxID=582475 RepID=A0A0K9FHR9_9BACI|nr:hypothetical protein [Lysinibacillus xylanilyticus]KMY33773.1 hypothetical protein ACZ11_01460 [Lysinibacillus xylanilyticus]